MFWWTRNRNQLIVSRDTQDKEKKKEKVVCGIVEKWVENRLVKEECSISQGNPSVPKMSIRFYEICDHDNNKSEQ